MTSEFKLAPSILSADFSDLKLALTQCEEGGAHWIHIDVMDNQFVPNLTIGPPVVKSLRPKTNKFLDKLQANIAKAIQAQGTVLAGQQSGQSMLLSLQQAEREYGFEQAQIDATIFDAAKAYGIDKYGIDLDKYSSDMRAMNDIQTSAHMAPTASFMTIKPIKQNAPKKPSILGPILAGATTAITAGSALGGEGYWGRGFGENDWGWQT